MRYNSRNDSQKTKFDELRKLTDEDLKQDAEDLKRDGETMGKIKSRLKKKEKPIKLPKPDTDVSLIDQINWKNMPKALINGVFRYFTKFSLFSTTNKPGLIAKLTELLQTLITKLKGK